MKWNGVTKMHPLITRYTYICTGVNANVGPPMDAKRRARAPCESKTTRLGVRGRNTGGTSQRTWRTRSLFNCQLHCYIEHLKEAGGMGGRAGTLERLYRPRKRETRLSSRQLSALLLYHHNTSPTDAWELEAMMGKMLRGCRAARL